MRLSAEMFAVALGALLTTGPGPEAISVHRTWYANGQLAEERGWIAGRETGAHRGWWPNGKPRFIYTYHDGLLSGVSREWFPGGALLSEQRYEAGHEAGLQRMYWEDGRVRASYEVRDGRRYGLLGSKGCVARDSLTVSGQ